MRVITPLSVFIGLLVNAPALWGAFEDPSADLTVVLLRFVLATVLAGIGIGGLRLLIYQYVQDARRREPVAVEPAAITIERGSFAVDGAPIPVEGGPIPMGGGS